MLYEDNDYLIHFGIKGQRWGVRRFQNLDGTLTAEGRKRLRKDSDVKADFNANIASKKDKIEDIQNLSKKLKDISEKRDKAYKKWTSTVELSDEEKSGPIKKVIDSWFGRKLTTNNEKKAYEFEVKELLSDTLMDDHRPDNIRNVDKQFYKASDEYWHEVINFEKELIKEYSNIEVYSTKKGIFGLDVIDKKMSGEDFIKQLIKDDKLDIMLGKNWKNRNPKQNADLLLDEAINRLYKQIDVSWYNKQFT